MKRRTIFLLPLIFPLIVVGQPELPQLPGRSRPGMFISTVAFTNPATNEQRIDVHLRVPLATLVPVMSADASSVYLRRGELSVECVDSAGTVQGRALAQIEIPSSAPDDTPSPPGWIERSVSISLPAGRFAINAEIADLNSRNRILSRAPLPESRGEAQGCELAFIYEIPGGQHGEELPSPEPGEAEALRPANFGNGFLFSARGGGVLALWGVPDSVGSVVISYAFHEEREGSKPAAPVLTGEAREFSLYGTPEIVKSDAIPGTPFRYLFRRGGGSVRYVLLPLPLERLPLRRYSFEAKVKWGERMVTCPAKLVAVWPDQPESLRDVTYALKALRFIAPPHVVDSLLSGGFEEQVLQLENFWKERDATPATADNPVMTEFYKRVDHARAVYMSLSEPDGTKSDRGRIYILHGPPARIERKLDPDEGFTEVWLYERPRREFLFRDAAKNGTYLLVTPRKP